MCLIILNFIIYFFIFGFWIVFERILVITELSSVWSVRKSSPGWVLLFCNTKSKPRVYENIVDLVSDPLVLVVLR